MLRIVRVVEVVDDDVDELRRRAAGLPNAVVATVVPTGAGVVVTLSRPYRATPGARGRAVRSLQRALRRVVGT